MKRIFYLIHLVSFNFFSENLGKKFILKACLAGFFFISVQSARAQTGQALNFDATQNNYVQLPFILSGSYTKEVWIYPTVSGASMNILSGSDEALWLFNGQLSAFHSSTSYTGITDGTVLNANTWYYVAVTYDSTTQQMNLYRNGVLVTGSPMTVPTFADTALYIGAYQANYSWEGSMDEVRIWNVARTAAQINNDMDSSLTGYEPGLIAYYNFNENIAGGDNTGSSSDSLLFDSSYNKCNPYNGTLVNFTLTGATSNWIAPGAPLLGASQMTYPNLKVSGNSTCINNNDTSPSSVDSTYFGNSSGSPVFVTYTIQNNGTASLNIDSVSIGGANSTDFFLTTPPASSVNPGGSTSFIVEFGPTAIGIRNATVNIYTNDSDAIPFLYRVQGNATVVLAVVFQSFTGYINGASAILNWKTSGELNNKGFEILRSTDGVGNWQPIGYVAANTASSDNSYSFTDVSPLPGINTYRLQQIDLNGNSKLSSIVALNFATKGSGISVYPNPAKSLINLSFNDNQLLNTPVQVSTVTGRVLSTVILTGNSQELSLDNLPDGIYILSFSNGDVKRIIKQ